MVSNCRAISVGPLPKDTNEIELVADKEQRGRMISKEFDALRNRAGVG